MRISILDLNQHCLLLVFRYLDVYDSINFGESCKFLHTVSQLAMTKYKRFVLSGYQNYEFRRKVFGKHLQAIPLRKVLSYVAPNIELLGATEVVERRGFPTANYYSVPFIDPSQLRERNERLQIFLQFDMPKLKSLRVQNIEHLTYIKSLRTIQKLTICDLNLKDLNKYVSGMSKLTTTYAIFLGV